MNHQIYGWEQWLEEANEGSTCFRHTAQPVVDYLEYNTREFMELELPIGDQETYDQDMRRGGHEVCSRIWSWSPLCDLPNCTADEPLQVILNRLPFSASHFWAIISALFISAGV